MSRSPFPSHCEVNWKTAKGKDETPMAFSDRFRRTLRFPSVMLKIDAAVTVPEDCMADGALFSK
jgi:hypothetical protein